MLAYPITSAEFPVEHVIEQAPAGAHAGRRAKRIESNAAQESRIEFGLDQVNGRTRRDRVFSIGAEPAPIDDGVPFVMEHIVACTNSETVVPVEIEGGERPGILIIFERKYAGPNGSDFL